MDIEKEREAFENLWLAGGGNFDNFIFSEDQGKYAAIENSNLTDKQKEIALYVVNNAYLFFVGGFKQAAKAQVVPEGYVLIKASDRDQEMLELIDQRDHMESQAEELKDKLQALYCVDFGEHSSCNFPFQNAIDYEDSDLVLVEKARLMQIVGSAAIIEPITRGNPLMSKYKTELEFILSTVRAMIEAQEPTND